jgi:hypothetical protein
MVKKASKIDNQLNQWITAVSGASRLAIWGNMRVS